MSLLFETIKCQNRQLFNLEYHNHRIEQSSGVLLGSKPSFSLENIAIPDFVSNAIHRCRVSYDSEIRKIEFFEYQLKHPHKIKLIEDSVINYEFKYENRTVFHDLILQNRGFDDVIITQNGLITDSTYANLAFFDGRDWFTPTTFLLRGTKRTALIDKGLLKECEISVSDLSRFTKFTFINAMRDFDESYFFEIDNHSELILSRC